MNAIVGDNGILTQAQKATIASKKATILEDLNMELVKYNIGSFTNETTGAREMITDLLNKELIDGVLTSSGDYIQDANNGIGIPLFDASNNYTGQIQYPVAKDEFSLVIYAGSDGTYQAEFGEVTMSSGGSVSSGTVMVTQDKFNNTAEDTNDKGKFEITGDASVMFVDEVSGELSISVKSGVHAKVNIFKNMTLTNAGLKRSAIDIEPGGILDLYIAEGVTVTVDSGVGSVTMPSTSWNYVRAEGVIGGNGGYAGIHVPHYDNDTTIKRVVLKDDGTISRKDGTNADFTYTNYIAGDATLNVSGAGTLICYGGDAGDGGNGGRNNLDWAAGAGGGAGAGIGGNGGNGAVGSSTPTAGDAGEDCGVITISNSVKIEAYGGTGGSGGGVTLNVNPSTGALDVQSGGGGGGFPGAGIGGGRCRRRNWINMLFWWRFF